jgi:branched-chain amino acid transport system substrate-binding protein
MERKLSRRDFFKVSIAMTGGAYVGSLGIPRGLYAQEPIKIGIVTSISGPYSWMGQDHVRGAEIALEVINKEGGWLGRRVELIVEDDETNPSVAVRKARKLIQQDGVHFLSSPTASSVAMALIEVCSRLNTILILANTGTPKLTGSLFKEIVFRLNPNTAMRAAAGAKFFEGRPEKTFYSLAEDTEWGRVSVSEFKKRIQAQGKEWLGETFAPFGTTDYSTYITKIKSMNPNVVWIVVAATRDSLIKQAYDFGLTKQTFMISESAYYLRDLQIIGEKLLGTYGVDEYFFDLYNTDENLKFVELHRKKFNSDPMIFAADTYQVIRMMLGRAIEKARSIETEKVIKALEGLRFKGLAGEEFYIRECDHQNLHFVYVAEAVTSAKFPHPVLKILKKFSGAEIAIPPKETENERCLR